MSLDKKIISDKTVNFQIDKKIYSLDSIKETAYRLAGDFFFEISEDKNSFRVLCNIKEDSIYLENSKDGIKNIFFQTLNDQSLREKIRSETSDIRNLIIASAFSGILEKDNDSD